MKKQFTIVHSACLLGISCSVSLAGPPILSVAVTGQPAPGIGNDTQFGYIYNINLNETGHVSLTAHLQGPGIVGSLNRDSVWAGLGDQLQLVARAGDPASSAGNGLTFSQFQMNVPIPINSSGQVSLYAQLAGTGVITDSNEAIFAGAPGALSLVARENDAAPGAPGFKYGGRGVNSPSSFLVFWFTPLNNSAGQVLYQSGLFQGQPAWTSDAAIFTGQPNSPTALLRIGDPAPGAEPGINLGDFSSLAMNASGQIAFTSYLFGPSASPDNGYALWLGATDGNFKMVARAGNPAPDLPPGILYNGHPDMQGTAGNGAGRYFNDAGQIAFASYLRGPGVPTVNNFGNDYALFAGDPDKLKLVARGGDHAPGTPDGVVFSRTTHCLDPDDFPDGPPPCYPGVESPMFGPQLNSAGKVLFTGILAGPGITNANDSGLWGGPPDNIKLLFREGQHVPGLPDDILFGTEYGQSTPFRRYFLNSQNQIALEADILGPDNPKLGFVGLFAANLGDELTLIARTGDLLDTGFGLRTIEQLELSGFNDAGLLAFHAEFGDQNSGVFLVTVPEPGSLLAGWVALSLLSLRRRKSTMIPSPGPRQSA